MSSGVSDIKFIQKNDSKIVGKTIRAKAKQGIIRGANKTKVILRNCHHSCSGTQKSATAAAF